MPRPPILPVIDWKTTFEQARSYQAWLEGSENAENKLRIESARQSLVLPEYASVFLQALPRDVHVIAIAEDWCGDVVRHVPCLMKIADTCPRIHVRFLHRAERPDIFVRYLTNGGEAIPKFVFLNDNFVECGNWGPMPDACRELIARGKACQDVGAARQRVAQHYEADNARRIVFDELLRLIDIAASTIPDPAASLLQRIRTSQ